MTRRHLCADQAITTNVHIEWMKGGHFLVQRAEWSDGQQHVTSVEYVGLDKEKGGFTSHSFDSLGNAFRYTWELEGDAVTIWLGEVGADARFQGHFDDANTLTGGWRWPSGGFDATVTRTSKGPQK